MTIPQTVLNYKQALITAVSALDWLQYQTILCQYQAYHADTSSEPFFLPHGSKLLLLAVIEKVTATKTIIVKANIIKSLIELGGLTAFDNFGDGDCVSHRHHTQPGDRYDSSYIFEQACLRGGIEEIKLLLAAGCQIDLEVVIQLLSHLEYRILSLREITRVLLLLQHSQLDFSWLFTDGVIDGQTGVTAHFNAVSDLTHLANAILPSLTSLRSKAVGKAFLTAGMSLTRLDKAGPVVLHTLDFNRDEETINMLIALGLIDHQVVDEYVKDRGEDELSFVRLMLKKQKLVKLPVPNYLSSKRR